MDATTTTLNEIRLAGFRALSRELGPVGMARFLQPFETGHGDYTRERHRWLGQYTVSDVARAPQERRKGTMTRIEVASNRYASSRSFS
jgi:hypothetical protein